MQLRARPPPPPPPPSQFPRAAHPRPPPLPRSTPPPPQQLPGDRTSESEEKGAAIVARAAPMASPSACAPPPMVAGGTTSHHEALVSLISSHRPLIPQPHAQEQQAISGKGSDSCDVVPQGHEEGQEGDCARQAEHRRNQHQRKRRSADRRERAPLQEKQKSGVKQRNKEAAPRAKQGNSETSDLVRISPRPACPLPPPEGAEDDIPISIGTDWGYTGASSDVYSHLAIDAAVETSVAAQSARITSTSGCPANATTSTPADTATTTTLTKKKSGQQDRIHRMLERSESATEKIMSSIMDTIADNLPKKKSGAF